MRACRPHHALHTDELHTTCIAPCVSFRAGPRASSRNPSPSLATDGRQVAARKSQRSLAPAGGDARTAKEPHDSTTDPQLQAEPAPCRSATLRRTQPQRLPRARPRPHRSRPNAWRGDGRGPAHRHANPLLLAPVLQLLGLSIELPRRGAIPERRRHPPRVAGERPQVRREGRSEICSDLDESLWHGRYFW